MYIKNSVLDKIIGNLEAPGNKLIHVQILIFIPHSFEIMFIV